MLALVGRGAARRQLVEADTSLRSYRAEAHGFVYFLAQVGSGLTEPPRLVKADELRVEVYWRAPGISKQTILGWRDGTWLPTDINYHRDHLGVVTNNFGNRIRIGEGDEVRDVFHPLSPQGLAAYDFALQDSLAITANTRTVQVYEVAVRPKVFTQPLVIGTLYLDVATAEVVQFRFSFTPSAYLDAQLEDISIVLENALYEGRYWLPERQEIEIRRRTTWLDFPARGIIKGAWEIGSYTLNAEFPPALYAAPSIGGLREPAPDATDWPEPLEDAIAAEAQPVTPQDMAALRRQVERIAGDRALSGLQGTRIATNSISDLAHVNRVQGLTLGFGLTVQAAERRLAFRPYAAYGTSDGRLTGRLVVDLGLGTNTLSLGAGRRVQDVSDFLVTAPVVNSITSQEVGQDYGDYALVDWVRAGIRRPVADRTALSLAVALETSHDMAVTATPARGSYRPNPALGAGQYTMATLTLTREAAGMAARHDLSGRTLAGGGLRADRLPPGVGRTPLAGAARAGGRPGARVRRGRRRRAAGVPQLRHGRAGLPRGLSLPRVRREKPGAGARGVALHPARSGHSARHLRQHRADLRPGALRRHRLERAGGVGHPVGGERRAPEHGGPGDGMVHGAHPTRGRRRAPRRALRGDVGHHAGVVEHPVAAGTTHCPVGGLYFGSTPVEVSCRMAFLDEWLVPTLEATVPEEAMATIRQAAESAPVSLWEQLVQRRIMTDDAILAAISVAIPAAAGGPDHDGPEGQGVRAGRGGAQASRPAAPDHRLDARRRHRQPLRHRRREDAGLRHRARGAAAALVARPDPGPAGGALPGRGRSSRSCSAASRPAPTSSRSRTRRRTSAPRRTRRARSRSSAWWT